MSLNIKRRETYDLAHELARQTGENVTVAVTRAIEERLNRLRPDEATERAERLVAIGSDCAPRLRESYRSADHADLLYDELGLPK